MARIPGVVHTFGGFELDADSGLLTKDGRPVRLPPQPLKLLALLADRQGRLVTRDEIRQELWDGATFVDFEQGINQAIKQIRMALGDDPESPRFVVTIPRRGYRFVAPVVLGGEKPAADHAPTSTPRETAGKMLDRRRVIAIGAAALVLSAALLALVIGRRTAALGTSRLMVLPLKNFSGDPAQDFLAEGLTEELITQLSNVRPDRLRVIARTSAMKYAGTAASVAEIGRQLHIDYVVEGSVRREGDRVRVAAQLIRVADETHLWATSVDRDLMGIIELQRDVASAVARGIGVSLAGPPMEPKQPQNWEAYSAYLKGRQMLLDTKTSGTVRLAIDYFKHATSLDSDFALAYAGLAYAYADQIDYDRPSPEALALCKRAAERAAALDPDLAEASVALGQAATAEWRWSDAERFFRKAIAARPGNEEAHHSFAHLLSDLGRHDEAIAESRRLLELDPLSPHMNAHLGLAYHLARRLDEASDQLERAVKLEPAYIRSHTFLGAVYLDERRFTEAVATLQKAVSLRGDSMEGLSALARAHILSGDRASGLAVLRQLEDFARTRFVSPLEFAIVYAALDDRDKVFTLLEEAYTARSGRLAALRVHPAFVALHDDPRFNSLLARIGA